MEWDVRREGHVSLETHGDLAALLRAAYPHFPDHFHGRRSWSYLRPELRVVGRRDGVPVATAGVLRRFLEVGGRDQLVAIVGLVAVHPDAQGAGLGGELLDRVNSTLRELDVPFGVLLCGPRQVPFYRRAGWHQMSPRRVRHLTDDTVEPDPVVDEVTSTMFVLPVRSSIDEWPDGVAEWHCASI